MNRISISVIVKGLLVNVGMALPLVTGAQSIIEMTNTPYVVKPEIQFIIDVPKPVNTAKSDVVTFVVDTPKSSAPLTPAPLTPAGMPWSVVSGSYLRETLQEWANKAGWSLVWGLSQTDDFRLETSNVYVGEFKDGVRNLINSLPARIQIHAELRPDNTPPLLHITRDYEGQK